MIKFAIKKLFNLVGIDLVRYNVTALDRFFQLLKSANFSPKHIVDVGANRGNWTRSCLRYFPNAQYTLLEPQEWLKDFSSDLLKSERIVFYAVGAGEEDSVLKFSINNSDVSSSFRYSNEEANRLGFQQIDVPVVTLNSLLRDSIIPDIIKIDAEGLDMSVLRGADSFFGKTELFLVEACVVYKGFENDLFNLIAFMDNRGYKVFDFTDFNRTRTQSALWLVEIAFIKKGGYLDAYPFVY